MKRIVLTVIISVIAVLILEAVAGLVFMYSGAYNISTYNHDNGTINWFFDTGMTRAVDHHAQSIKAPTLDDPALVETGFKEYHEMCAVCHGAPGVAPEEIDKGLWPKAPNLVKTVPTWTPAQLFWITKYGIKFSAMPAWGPSHDDSEIWSMVAFLEQLPHLSSTNYHTLEQKTQGQSNPG